MPMQIRFLGPLGKVTGSCTWMRDEDRGWNFLVDCGMQQGEPSAEQWNTGKDWPFDPSELNFVILTHAHVDHCGLIPELYKKGFGGKVYCTQETAELATVLLRDSGRLVGTPFERCDVDRIQFHTHGGDTKFGGYHPVAEDLFIRYFRSGHILGAASVTVVWGDPKTEQRSIVFSGDIGPSTKGREVLPIGKPLMYPRPADFAVVESTYGDRARTCEDMDPVKRRERLAAVMDRTMERGGTLAIPAFSMGRTQDVLFDIHFVVASDPGRYEGMTFLLDSPTASLINDITAAALEKVKPQGANGKVRPMWLGNQVLRDLGLDKDDPDHFEHALEACRLALATNLDGQGLGRVLGNAVAGEWRSLFRTVERADRELAGAEVGPRLIVMSSGMCDGGPAVRWLPSLLRSANNEVALTGFCAPGTVGDSLQELGRIPNAERRRLRDELLWQTTKTKIPRREIMASISTLSGYSAHADQTGLAGWVIHEAPDHCGDFQAIADKVFIQHGHDRARKALSVAIGDKAAEHGLAIEIERPGDPSEWIELDAER